MLFCIVLCAPFLFLLSMFGCVVVFVVGDDDGGDYGGVGLTMVVLPVFYSIKMLDPLARTSLN